MTEFPTPGVFNTDDTLVEGELRQRLEDVLRASKEFPGASASVLKVISGDAITPDSAAPGMIRLQPETGTADDLTRIVQTNARDGALLHVRLADDSYQIKLKPGGISPSDLKLLFAESEYLLNDVSQVSCFERQGSVWQEILRSGAENFHTVGLPGQPPFGHADWSAAVNPARFYKDSSGSVSIYGEAVNLTTANTNQSVFTLPLGFRPPHNRRFLCHDGQTPEAAIVLVLATTGEVWYNGGADGVLQSAVRLWLDPIRFRVV